MFYRTYHHSFTVIIIKYGSDFITSQFCKCERMEIASVQRVDPRQMRWVVPLFGGYGFFGYYGYYFDLKTFEKVVVYASEWKNLVEIVDIYEQRYYVSCTQADELVALLQSE